MRGGSPSLVWIIVRTGSASALEMPSFTSSGPRAWMRTRRDPPSMIKPPIMTSSPASTRALVERLTKLPSAAEVRCENPNNPVRNSSIAAAPRAKAARPDRLSSIQSLCSTFETTDS